MHVAVHAFGHTHNFFIWRGVAKQLSALYNPIKETIFWVLPRDKTFISVVHSPHKIIDFGWLKLQN